MEQVEQSPLMEEPAEFSLDRRQAPDEFRLAFFFLLIFTVVLYVRPQDFFPALNVLRLQRVSAILAVLSFILGMLKHPERLPVKNTELRLMLLFGVFILASVPFSIWRGGSIAELKDMISKTYIIFILIAFTTNSVKRVRWLLFVLLTCGAFLAIYAMYQNITGQGVFVAGRLKMIVRGMSGDPNDRALVFVFMLPFAIFCAFQAARRLGKLYYTAIAIILVVGILETLSRGGLLGLFAVAGYFAFKMLRERKGLVVGLIFIGFVSIFFLPERVLLRATSLFDQTYDEQGTIGARTEVMKRGLTIFASRPILGVGVGMFTVAEGQLPGRIGKWNAAHNTLLQVAAETGIFGAIAFLALLIAAYKNCLRIQRDFLYYGLEPAMVDYARALEMAFLGFFVCAFFLSQAYVWNLYYLLGLSAALRRIAFRIERDELPEEAWEEAPSQYEMQTDEVPA